MINRLRQRSLKEIKVRANQGMHMLMERLHLARNGSLPNTIEFITPVGNISDGSLTADQLPQITKPGHHFYRSVRDLAACREILASRFPDEQTRTVRAADKVCKGRFDLLGYKDLSFGDAIPNWHLDPIAGRTSPRVHWSRISELDANETGDKKVVWELNRHQFFVVLGQAYALTGQECYAECFSRLIRSWMDDNPPKVGINWLSSLELAFRSLSWIWAFHLFRNSPHFTPELLARMTKYLCAFALHIKTYLSTYFSPNTHLTGEALGLYLLGSFLPEVPDSKNWKQTGYDILMDALEFQVRPDGTYCEQSSHYLRYTIDFYCSLLVLRRLESSEPEPIIEAKLNRLFDCLLHIALPDGQSPNFGDDDGGRLHSLDGSAVTDFRPAFALGAVLLQRGDLKWVAGDASPALLWLLGTEGLRKFDELIASEPIDTTKAFPDGGLFAARSDWSDKSDSILIDCGPHGFLNGGHAHADALSFIMSVSGMPVFIDSGTYNYTLDLNERNRFRSATAHNCLTVDGTSSSIPAGPFSWKSKATSRLIDWHETPGKVCFRGTHDGFSDLGVKYDRRIEIDFEQGIDVEDIVWSSSEKLYDIHYILSPEVIGEVLDPSGKALIRTVDGKVILNIDTAVFGEIQGEGIWQILEWTVSPLYGERTRSSKLVYSLNGSGELRIRTRFSKPKG